MRTGDTVIYNQNGERWIVAYVDGDYMSWVGWPEGEARTADCTLVRECSDNEHVMLLEEIARSNAGRRTRKAQDALDALDALRAAPSDKPGDR